MFMKLYDWRVANKLSSNSDKTNVIFGLLNLDQAFQFQQANNWKINNFGSKKVKGGQSWHLWKGYQLKFCTWLI